MCWLVTLPRCHSPSSHGCSGGAFLLTCLLGVALSDFAAGFQRSLQPAIACWEPAATGRARPRSPASTVGVFRFAPSGTRVYKLSGTAQRAPEFFSTFFKDVFLEQKWNLSYRVTTSDALTFAFRRSICARGSSCVSLFKPCFCDRKSELFP